MLSALFGVEGSIYELHDDGVHAVMQCFTPPHDVFAVISMSRPIDGCYGPWHGPLTTPGHGRMKGNFVGDDRRAGWNNIHVHAICYTADDAIKLLEHAPLYNGIGNLPPRPADGPLSKNEANALRDRLARAEAAAGPLNIEERQELEKMHAERVFLLEQCFEADDKLEQVTEWFNGREPLPDFLREECETDVLPTLVRPK